MADRIVYLVTKITPAMAQSDLVFLDDAALASLMAGEGLEVISTTERSVAIGGRSTKATMMVLRPAGDNRGVSVRGRDGQGGRGGGMVTVSDDFGTPRELSLPAAIGQVMTRVTQALAGLNSASHLGGTKDHSLPGMQVVSSEMVSKAFDVGMAAGMRGEGPASCPFPHGTMPAQQWLKGLRAAQSRASQTTADPVAAQEAFDAGLRAARDFAEEDEVSCPYPSGSPLRASWLEGFQRGGGRVE